MGGLEKKCNGVWNATALTALLEADRVDGASIIQRYKGLTLGPHNDV